MRACELGSPVAIKADKYDMPAARNWQNYSGEADSVKIYTRVEFACQIFVRHLSPFMREQLYQNSSDYKYTELRRFLFSSEHQSYRRCALFI